MSHETIETLRERVREIDAERERLKVQRESVMDQLKALVAARWDDPDIDLTNLETFRAAMADSWAVQSLYRSIADFYSAHSPSFVHGRSGVYTADKHGLPVPQVVIGFESHEPTDIDYDGLRTLAGRLIAAHEPNERTDVESPVVNGAILMSVVDRNDGFYGSVNLYVHPEKDYAEVHVTTRGRERTVFTGTLRAAIECIKAGEDS